MRPSSRTTTSSTFMAVREKVATTEDEAEQASGVVVGSDDHHEDNHDHPSDLSMLQAATLLTADCLGVGILALPKDVQELGWVIGLGFLILNLPVNYYSGKILAVTATHVEQPGGDAAKDGIVRSALAPAPTVSSTNNTSDFEMVTTSEEGDATAEPYPEDPMYGGHKDGGLRDRNGTHAEKNGHENNEVESKQVPTVVEDVSEYQQQQAHEEHVGVTSSLAMTVSTQDYIGLTGAVMASPQWSGMVTALFFCNIFLVLGDYILVMSYAVAAMLGDNICLPWAGVLASILMFAVSQLRTMASLGREASIISLVCLFIVLVQCLVSAEEHAEPAKTARTSVVGESVLLRKFSALASIGFAMGSQKLFLNIRHEMRHKQEAPTTLLYSLGAYGTAYVVTCVLAGPDPPAFLFEAIPEGIARRTAGLLLWIHVAVSYSINSQAICSSLNRRLSFWPDRPAEKWLVLTGGMALSSYTIANAIPFFQDLVSLIGALTSVPLTLTLPALLYRYAIEQVSLWRPVVGSSSSYQLLMYSMELCIQSIEIGQTKANPFHVPETVIFLEGLEFCSAMPNETKLRITIEVLRVEKRDLFPTYVPETHQPESTISLGASVVPPCFSSADLFRSKGSAYARIQAQYHSVKC
eukprot:scaffold3849_cov179-Amphora_coffeaeformis.AAC.10